MIQWKKYHVGLSEKGKLFLGYVVMEGKFPKWKYTSDDRTEEIVRAIIEKFRLDKMKKFDKGIDRPYAGCKIEGLGSLIFLEDGWDFLVKPSLKKIKKRKK